MLALRMVAYRREGKAVRVQLPRRGSGHANRVAACRIRQLQPDANSSAASGLVSLNQRFGSLLAPRSTAAVSPSHVDVFQGSLRQVNRATSYPFSPAEGATSFGSYKSFGQRLLGHVHRQGEAYKTLSSTPPTPHLL